MQKDEKQSIRVLDLFCGAGGATKGMQDVGYQVTGVDIRQQPNYCGNQFHQSDAMSFPLDEFDFIWASPPCQHYTCGAKKWNTQDCHPHLIPKLRDRLIASRKPYVIENVLGAYPFLQDPITLCGTQFGLGVFRHRLFECSFNVPNLLHVKHKGRIGDGKYVTVTGHSGGSSKRDGWKNGNVHDARIAMGIDWMNWAELVEAIPPAYSTYIIGCWK